MLNIKISTKIQKVHSSNSKNRIGDSKFLDFDPGIYPLMMWLFFSPADLKFIMRFERRESVAFFQFLHNVNSISFNIPEEGLSTPIPPPPYQQPLFDRTWRDYHFNMF